MTSNDDTASTIVHSTAQFASFFHALRSLPLDCMLIVIMNIFISITSQFNFYHMIKVRRIRTKHAWLVRWLHGTTSTAIVACCAVEATTRRLRLLCLKVITAYTDRPANSKNQFTLCGGEGASASEWADGLFLDTNLKSIHRASGLHRIGENEIEFHELLCIHLHRKSSHYAPKTSRRVDSNSELQLFRHYKCWSLSRDAHRRFFANEMQTGREHSYRIYRRARQRAGKRLYDNWAVIVSCLVVKIVHDVTAPALFEFIALSFAYAILFPRENPNHLITLPRWSRQWI